MAKSLEDSGWDTYLPHRDGVEAFVMKNTDQFLANLISPLVRFFHRLTFAVDVYFILKSHCLVFNLNGRVPDEGAPDLSLFLSVLHTLEAIGQAFQRRARQMVEVPSAEPFEVWCACAEDVILGKLMAWAEGRSHKHEVDIYDMMVFHYLEADPAQSATFDEAYVDTQTANLGPDVAELWGAIKDAARREANRTD